MILKLNGCASKIWLVGCFGFNGPLRQYFSLYRAASQREGERGECASKRANSYIDAFSSL